MQQDIKEFDRHTGLAIKSELGEEALSEDVQQQLSKIFSSSGAAGADDRVLLPKEECCCDLATD